MATAADIGADFSNYSGNAALGGSTAELFHIDTQPLSQLAQYTYFYNREKWKQKQDDTNAKVKKLADISNISLNDLRGKDKEQASREFTDLLSYASEYARKTPKDNAEKLQQELEWQTKYGAFKNNFDSGKGRAVSYYAHLNAIKQTIPDATTQDEAIKQLNKNFDSTGIDTPISAVPNFKMETIDIPNPVSQKVNVVGVDPNNNIDVEASIYNPAINSGNADATVFGLKKAYPSKGSKEYLALSDNEKAQADIQGTIESSGRVWSDMVEPFNAIRKNYVNADGSFNAAKFEDENASNSIVMRAYGALKNLDKYSRSKYTDAVNGIFNDKGISFKLPPNINPADFKSGFIDFSKDVTPTQLVMGGSFAKYSGDVFEKKLTRTGEATTRRGQTLDYDAAMARIKAEETRWKATQVGSTTQINGAAVRGNRIYSDLLKLAGSNGTITPDKVRRLNVEQLKYLGVEVPDKVVDDKVIKGGFKPLELDKDKEYVIQLVDGEVRVLTPKGDEKNLGRTPSGDFIGEFDPSKSSNIHNIRTNILNEELQKAGSKELNAYMGVDVTGRVTSTTDGGSTTISGSTKGVTEVDGLDVNGFKKEGKYWRYKDGTLYDAKGNIVK